jgi:hypothetical protein
LKLSLKNRFSDAAYAIPMLECLDLSSYISLTMCEEIHFHFVFKQKGKLWRRSQIKKTFISFVPESWALFRCVLRVFGDIPRALLCCNEVLFSFLSFLWIQRRSRRLRLIFILIFYCQRSSGEIIRALRIYLSAFQSVRLSGHQLSRK